MIKRVRCAIYTRKSSEEGLELSFNSLEAQREACEAFILSQKHEGWSVLANHYDDGGFSGGTMERPALNKLLKDVQSENVDTIVVYKVDRLTRSLADFAKIIEILDSHGVSFVSVTQQFNTTSSMGRLTLNVLLSFAQFEREITGERIRDKIAASKKKGMWMGGVIALGYDCVDRQLVVNQAEANKVRQIFRMYLQLGCVTKLKEFLDRKQIYSKTRTDSSGRTCGGAPFSRGSLYHLLNSRIYIGEIVHGEQSYRGQHQAIVPLELWNKVAARLRENNQSHRTGKSHSTPSLLSGILFDSHGVRFTPTHAVKNGKRYRYYTSQSVVTGAGVKPTISRFPAQELERFVKSEIHLLLQTPDEYTAGMKQSPIKDAVAERAGDLAKKWPELEIFKQHEFVRNILRRVTVGQTTIVLEIDKTKFVASLLGHNTEIRPSIIRPKLATLNLTRAFQALRARGEVRMIAPQGDAGFERAPVMSLVKVAARAHEWYQQIVAGEIATISQLAEKSGLTERYVRRVLQCTNLSPQIIEGLLAGKHPPNATVKEIVRARPLDWREQDRTFFGQDGEASAF
jgi:site-specific DNA recombinase